MYDCIMALKEDVGECMYYGVEKLSQDSIRRNIIVQHETYLDKRTLFEQLIQTDDDNPIIWRPSDLCGLSRTIGAYRVDDHATLREPIAHLISCGDRKLESDSNAATLTCTVHHLPV